MSNAPTQKQINFVLTLAKERKAPWLGTTVDERVNTMKSRVHDCTATSRQVSNWINDLLGTQKDTTVEDDTEQITPGVYELPSTGEIFVVKRTRDKQRTYAKRLVEINSFRLNAKGEQVKIEFEYAPGAIKRIKPNHKMPLDRAKELIVQYGRCISCGRTLKAAQSVEQGIGPVCVKNFA